MSYFRIYIYLSLKFFFKSILNLSDIKEQDDVINKSLLKTSHKKKISLTSQCRVSFLLILKYLKKRTPKKKEIIFCAYNLPEMINIANNLDLKIIFCDLNYKTGFYDLNKLKKKINNKTLTVVLTNMFNTYEQSVKLKKICKKKKISIIEDNAIYFDNYTKKANRKIYSGSIGDFSIYSFNIMKNISALYGGAVTSNNNNFHVYLNNEILKFNAFNKKILFKQILIFFTLKIMALKTLYKYIFFNIIKNSHINNNRFFLKMFYPSLKFKVLKFPNYYFTNISLFSKKLIYYQLLKNKKRIEMHQKRKSKNIYYYNKFKQLKIKEINTIKIIDFNYQNFLDFPIMVKNKFKLNNFLLKHGIETRSYHYQNCEKIFSRKITCRNSQKFENQILCLPNHSNISFQYIDFIISTISAFYSNNNKEI